MSFFAFCLYFFHCILFFFQFVCVQSSRRFVYLCPFPEAFLISSLPSHPIPPFWLHHFVSCIVLLAPLHCVRHWHQPLFGAWAGVSTLCHRSFNLQLPSFLNAIYKSQKLLRNALKGFPERDRGRRNLVIFFKQNDPSCLPFVNLQTMAHERITVNSFCHGPHANPACAHGGPEHLGRRHSSPALCCALPTRSM